MKLTNTKGALRILETVQRPGADRILSMMSALVDDVYDEMNVGLCDLDMLTKEGNEEGFLDSLDKVALELADLMDDLDAGKMPEGLRVYTNTVLDSREHVRKLADTTRQWKELEETCRELKDKIADETHKLEEQQKSLKALEQQVADLKDMHHDTFLKKEECQAEIVRLQKEMAEIPQSVELLEQRRLISGQRKRYSMVQQYISDYIEDHSKEVRLAQKFELAEEKFRNDLMQVDRILGNLEQHYTKMLQFMETQRIEREKNYAGNETR